ncbi:ABC transporter ATP-binding protein/permease [Anaerosphaera multitolerans]|uniref:ABC transporter ATP-binding protein/permease n=1 Tax=Anaerosphaera multitolerans TaxID=2487351 RepID=A0A437S621_9FIRM|nr:ABC transporter ATP-binding protein/permease [Anaerosphaera multitolerans]RVU54428.1 ABC transporter ATP-binding protein/permease [Anaerosphaera multitolerans]
MIDKRLIDIFPNVKKYIFGNIFLKVLSLLLSVALVFCISIFLSNIYKYKGMNTKILLSIFIIAIVKGLISYISAIISEKSSLDAKNYFRNSLFSKIYRLGLRSKSEIGEAELIQLSVDGIEKMSSYYGLFLPQLIYSIIAPILLFIILSRVNLVLALMNLCFVFLIPLAIILFQKIAKKVTKNYWSSYVNLTDMFIDNLNGLITLKMYGSDKKRHELMNRYSENFRKATMKLLSVQLNNITIMDIIVYLGTGLVTFFAILFFLKGDILLENALIFVILSVEFFLPLRQLGSYFHISMNGVIAVERMLEILEIEEGYEVGKQFEDINIDLEINNLSFKFGEKEIFKNINISFQHGKITAIVGESGSGKSTIVGLLMRLILNYDGEILLNRVAIKEYSKSSFYKNVTLINSKPYIFKGSLRYNLKIGNPKATDEDMMEALRKVDLYKMFMERDGLDTQIELEAKNLSGGQIQRLAIARALLKNPKVYILDEATSNIDIESEKIILKVLEELRLEKTIILITHRLKSIKNVDFIYCLKNNQVCEEGDFLTLMKEKGYFYNLYTFQEELERVGGVK